MDKQLVLPLAEVARAIGWWVRCHYDSTFPLRDEDMIEVHWSPEGLVVERRPAIDGGGNGGR